MAIDVDTGPGGVEAAVPRNAYEAAWLDYHGYSTQPDTLADSIRQTDVLADSPQRLAALWCAHVDWTHAAGNPASLREDLTVVVKGKASPLFKRYALEAGWAVTHGQPTLCQLRLILDAMHPDYSHMHLKGATTEVLRAFLLAHPLLGQVFGRHKVYNPAKQANTTVTRPLPEEPDRLRLIAEAELWSMYPDRPPLPAEIGLHNVRRLLDFAQDQGVDIQALGRNSFGLPRRTRELILRAAEAYATMVPPTKGRRSRLLGLVVRGPEGWR